MVRFNSNQIHISSWRLNDDIVLTKQVHRVLQEPLEQPELQVKVDSVDTKDHADGTDRADHAEGRDWADNLIIIDWLNMIEELVQVDYVVHQYNHIHIQNQDRLDPEETKVG